MNYFITPSKKEGTCYFEFQKGPFQNRFWQEDSLLLPADDFDQLNLKSIFKLFLPDFSYYGITTVSKSQWKQIAAYADHLDSSIRTLFLELLPWVEECFEEYEVFSILGI